MAGGSLADMLREAVTKDLGKKGKPKGDEAGPSGGRDRGERRDKERSRGREADSGRSRDRDRRSRHEQPSCLLARLSALMRSLNGLFIRPQIPEQGSPEERPPVSKPPPRRPPWLSPLAMIVVTIAC